MCQKYNVTEYCIIAIPHVINETDMCIHIKHITCAPDTKILHMYIVKPNNLYTLGSNYWCKQLYT